MRPPVSQLTLLLRWQARLAVRGLPEGRPALLRSLAIAAVALPIALISLAPSYREVAASVLHALHAAHGAGWLPLICGRALSVVDATVFFFGSVFIAQIVNSNEMRVCAPAPVPARTIVAAQAVWLTACLCAFVFVFLAPLVALLALPAHLGWGGVIACLVIILTAAVLPLSVALLLAVILLRLIPASHARGTIALLAPVLGCTVGLASRVIASLSSASWLGRASAPVARAWEDSPFTWDGRALAAVLVAHPTDVVRYMEEWHQIDGRQAHRIVRRLQARIVQATQEGRWGKVTALQRLLTPARSAKVLAVRRVTENHGKHTPGVDRIVWDTPGKKMQAVRALQQRGYQPRPLRRTYVPKSNGKMRPLGIATMADRAMQTVYLFALAPIAEVTGDRNSYGFRRERATADAMAQCFTVLSQKTAAQWVFEGDICACFDRVSHAWLEAHVPMDTGILHKWLKAGFMEKHVLQRTDEGAAQGGPLSRASESRLGWSRTAAARTLPEAKVRS